MKRETKRGVGSGDGYRNGVYSLALGQKVSLKKVQVGGLCNLSTPDIEGDTCAGAIANFRREEVWVRVFLQLG